VGLRTIGFHAAAWTRGAVWVGDGWKQQWTGLTQPNGPRGGLPFRLTRRQTRFLLWWYAVDDHGRWVYTHGARRLAKGTGKSPFAAVLALIDFLAPVRFVCFDDRIPGGVRGKPVDMPLVQIAATSESQTANTMRMVRAFAPKKSPIVAAYNLDPGKTQYYRVPEGTLEIITSSATAAEGAESSLVVADETELWTPTNGGVELASTLEDNLAKSGSRMVETANSWVPGRQTVAEGSHQAWVAQEEGRYRTEGRILYDAVIAPPDTDMSLPDSLRPALEVLYDDCDWKKPHVDGEPQLDQPPDVTSIMNRIWSPKARPDDSRRKYLNRPTAAQDAWIEPEWWSVMTDHSVTVEPRDPVVLFFDGSKSRDATALVGCRISDGHVFTLGVWEPDQNDPNSTVDVADVDRVVSLAFANHQVKAFFADVREWESFALTEWPRRYGDRLEVWASPASRPPQAVAWDMRSHAYEFAKATEATLDDIEESFKAVRAGRPALFTHDGHPATGRHMGNARRRPHRDAVGIGKESPMSPLKIDAAVCVIGARMVRRVVSSARSSATGKRAGKIW
jgi:hypothetical protein